jgi:hypothetical protein
MNSSELMWTLSPYILKYVMNPSQITNMCVLLYKGYNWLKPKEEKIIFIHEKETIIDSEEVVIISKINT